MKLALQHMCSPPALGARCRLLHPANLSLVPLANAVPQSDAFAGDTPAARRLPAALTSLEDQLAALEAAVDQMARAPGKFGLDGDIIAGRREQVEGLRLEAAEVARICEGMGVRAGGSSGGGGGGGGWDEGGDDIAGGFQDVDLSGERRRGELGPGRLGRMRKPHTLATATPQGCNTANSM